MDIDKTSHTKYCGVAQIFFGGGGRVINAYTVQTVTQVFVSVREAEKKVQK